ncbi:sulfatase [Urbifossiella limnaea]|uniref:Arylsulfatase n=1 Tax=Urbifossiella limnaea TaxID=2528023 RepID=A0A517XZ07_9BACT|nr:sulfatase [Urbifossiella limnaea]QDU22698.1 Arylsulfatase precursor [Urbifossiella limnaea]
MNRVTILAILLGFALGSPARAADPPKPNILLVVGDDMGYADVGVHGCRDIPTPHLDALARAGTRFTSGYVSGPYCSPTRAGLLTGRYQTRFGHEFNPAAGPDVGLPLTETTLADRLRAAGYVTGLVGKWHLGNAPARHPQRRGFDEFFGFLGGAHPYQPGKGKADTVLRGTTPVDEKEYLTDAFRREAVAFVEKHRARPFFLYLAFNAVHTPMQATDAGLRQFGSIPNQTRRTYAAMMASMDDAVGAVRAKLRELKLEENTLVFFVSDNGGPTMAGTTTNGSANTPLRGSKRTTLEGGVRVPYFVAWPGRLPAGRTDDRPVIQLDILPTALSAAGVEVKPEWNVEGVNLIPYLSGPTLRPPHEALYWRFGQQMAVRQGDYKLVRYDTAADGGKGGVTGPRLYNLATDVGESTDLMTREPEKAKQLQALWDTWNTRNVAPLWGGGKQKG